MYVDHVYQHLHVLCMGKDREKALSTFRCSSWHGRGGHYKPIIGPVLALAVN